MNAPVKPDPALPQWRLDDLYVGRDDPRIEHDLHTAAAANAELATLKGALVAARADPARLGELIDRGIHLYEKASNLLGGVGAYAGLSTAIERDDAAWAKFEADIHTKSSQIAAENPG